MTDLYPTLVLWRAENGWTFLLHGSLSGVHPDDKGVMKLEIVEKNRHFIVTVEEVL